jgi:VWFA-related protein
MRRKLAALIFVLSLLAQAAGQQTRPAAEPRQGEQDEEEVVRITSNLIQVDAVVLDAQGRQVTDLNADDFELLEDGRAQTITNFSYFSNAAGPSGQPGASLSAGDAASVPSRSPSKTASAPSPPTRVRPASARRTIAFVVDDLGLTFEATAYVRRFLKKFVAEQMRPGDFVAVVRTSAGVGALQQFSGDPRLVEAAIDRVRFTPGFRAPTGSFAVTDDAARRDGENDSGKDEGAQARGKGVEDDFDRDALFTIGTLGALNYVLRGASELPGRKSVVLISENARLFKLTRRDASVREYLQHLADLANRASASVYDLDAGDLKPERLGSNLGIVTSVPSAPAQGSAGAGPPGSSAGALNAPGIGSPNNLALAEALLNDKELNGNRTLYETRSALRYLAKQTGGAEVFGIERVLEDQKGFYLIGYRPDDATFNPQSGGQRFHNIMLRVKRPGLRVRHRIGFYSTPEVTAASGAPATREGRLIRALTSPLASGTISLGLTPLFGNDAQTGSFMRALIHVDARGLEFTKSADGFRQAVIRVLAVTLGEHGKPLDEAGSTETVRVAEADFEKLLGDGLRYTVKVPVKKPGAYQLRIAVLDEASEHVGSANELVEVPDLSGGRLTLSGIVLSGRATPDTAKGAEVSAPTTGVEASSRRSGAGDIELEADPALRRLRPGMELHYNFVIYNALAEAGTGRPRLQTQVRLFRDGRTAYEGKPATFETAQQEDLGRLLAGGSIKLNRNAAPGEYVLQVVVNDLLSKEKARVATQWIAFEIVR